MTPPLIRGGQGRTDEQVRECAEVTTWLLLFALALIVFLLATAPFTTS